MCNTQIKSVVIIVGKPIGSDKQIIFITDSISVIIHMIIFHKSRLLLSRDIIVVIATELKRMPKNKTGKKAIRWWWSSKIVYRCLCVETKYVTRYVTEDLETTKERPRYASICDRIHRLPVLLSDLIRRESHAQAHGTCYKYV